MTMLNLRCREVGTKIDQDSIGIDLKLHSEKTPEKNRNLKVRLLYRTHHDNIQSGHGMNKDQHIHIYTRTTHALTQIYREMDRVIRGYIHKYIYS